MKLKWNSALSIYVALWMRAKVTKREGNHES